MFKVNWTELKKLGESAKKTSDDLNTSRLKVQEIVNSLPECWEGTDSEAFINRYNAFLNYLNNDVEYFDSLSQYFGVSSEKLNKVVNNHSQKIQKINKELEENENDIDLINFNDGGSNYV